MNDIEYYNRLHRNAGWKFGPFDRAKLPPTTRAYLDQFVPEPTPVSLHQPVRGTTHVFRLEHPVVKFLVHDSTGARTGDPGAHMWGDKDFNNIDNEQAHRLLGTWQRVANPDLRRRQN